MAPFDIRWLDVMPDAVVVVDARGEIVHANHRCETLLGWRPDELIGRPVEVLVPARFTEHAERRARFAAAPTLRPMGAPLQLTARHRAGHEIPVDIALNPMALEGERLVVASIRDVSAQRDVTERLRVQSVALDAAASGIVITDTRGVITWVNAAACRMTGYTVHELVGSPTSLLKSGAHDAAFYADLWATVMSGCTWQGAIINRRKDGSFYHEEQTIAPVAGPTGEITHFIAVKQDVTERIRAEQVLRETRDELARHVAEIEGLHAMLRDQAIRDPLTSLFNRRYLDETLPRELANARRDGTAVTIAVIDIDFFKRINDRHGHTTGDKVLVELGRILRAQSRSGDVACRYGGEEFVVVLLGAGLGDGVRRAEGWRDSFRSTTVSDGPGLVRSTLSAGLAEWQPGESAEQLFARADAALYLAKDAGRDRVVAATSPTLRRHAADAR
jgi:diguanylate cyclase (GGDEF)-like protein/PAS domain S-box-containing protein